jgi:pimeloyl-ACP methyl ester carboxylesterase
MSSTFTVLPRPGVANSSHTPTIKAPSEASFVETCGNLLPAASYLQTPNGRAAYYKLPPSSPAAIDSNSSTKSITRILYVHGIQTSAIGLQKLAGELSRRFPQAHSVLFDHWGHGLTDTPFVAHEPKLFHSLIKALMDRLGWKDAHFVGYSFGGSTTVTFAVAHPERVASIVLVAPAGLMRTSQFNELEQSYLIGGNGNEEQAQSWILDWLEGGQLIVPSDWKEKVSRGELVAEVVRDWQNKKHKGHKASVTAIFRDGGVFDSHAEFAKLAKIGIPIHCILGQLDDICNEKDLHDVGIQDVTVVANSGHGVVRDEVPQVTEFIGTFWRKM